MKTSKHLDKIFELGFWIDIEWNGGIQISYNANDVYPATAHFIDIMSCRYYKSKDVEYSFEDMIENVCDYFYHWYNENLGVIREFDDHYDPKSLEKLEGTCPHDITKNVARDLGLSDILKMMGDKD